MKVKDLAIAIGGTVELGPMEEVQQVQSPESAQPGDLTWIGDSKFAHPAIHATALLLGEDQPIPEQSHHQSVIRHPHPHAAFALSLQTLQPDPEPECSGISPAAHVSAEADIAADVSIGPGCVIGAQVVVGKGSRIAPGVVIAGPTHIGESVIIHPRVVIQSHSKIGNHCILQPGCVIGGDGFGYAPSPTGAVKIPHRGGVTLGEHVEIGALATIDKGVLENTEIGAGTKIDNLVHVAHNVKIGEHGFLAAQVGIAGSAVIGNQCEFGGQSGMIGHATIGDKVRVAAKSAVLSGGAEDTTLMGIPATDAQKMRKIYAILQSLPELRDRILALESKKDTPDSNA